MRITVDTKSKIVRIADHVFACAIGKNGSVPMEDGREGDGKTPLGSFKIRYGFYRADRIERPRCELLFWPMAKDDGWCDAPDDPAYNFPVRLPYGASTETLWRHDHVYDVILVISHNDSPPMPNLGSAIFLHIARESYAPTQGCVAISQTDMQKMIPLLRRGTKITLV